MALTNDETLDKRMRLLRSHGITTHREDMHDRPSEEIWNYQQIELGFNYRMTDLQAALGLSQMSRLDDFVNRRHVIADRYDRMLSALPVHIPWQHPYSYSSYHLYVIFLKLAEIKRSHRQVYEGLRLAGILVNLHYIPVYRQPYYEQMGFKAGYCSQAENYYCGAISIPMYPLLTESQQNVIVDALNKSLDA